ncbi:putative MFS family arabinose efflux permease [Micromonospora sp. Llam0]|uniref:MFS transporter n=1 Tax=Micromonospora sp. Llam0 TaxID=2485143 RepID=UPI000F47F46B|nr:MFS transporter [Micromonospora sp. Llam0]ROO62081.1 putative MFS family arabinose efflux permease [Micromonospora sp. Llam0]
MSGGDRRPARTPLAAAVPPLLVFFNPLTQLAYIPISVGLGRSLDLSPAQIGITIGAHSVATAAAGVLTGPLLDLVPVRRILLPGMLVNAVVSILLCLYQSYAVLTVGRLLTGFASGAVALCGQALVADLTQGDPKARDRGYSMLQTFVSMGAASALALGALAASLRQPVIVFAVGAGYATVLLTVVLVARLGRERPPASHPADVPFGQRIQLTLQAIRRMLGERRRRWLILSSIGIGLIMQGSHFGISVLLDRLPDLSTLERIGVSILIPCGVFTGSFINRMSLKRISREQLFTRLYLVIPLAAAAYAAVAFAGLDVAAVALTLVLLGTCLGALMPLSMAISVNWNPELRATAAATDALSRSVGQTTGPIAVGALVAVGGVSTVGVVVFGATLLGLAASRNIFTAKA